MSNNQQGKTFTIDVVMSIRTRFELNREEIEERLLYALKDSNYYRDKLLGINNWSEEELITTFEDNAITATALDHISDCSNYYNNTIDHINTEEASCVPTKEVN